MLPNEAAVDVGMDMLALFLASASAATVAVDSAVGEVDVDAVVIAVAAVVWAVVIWVVISAEAVTVDDVVACDESTSEAAGASVRDVTLAWPVRSYSSRLSVVDGGLLKLYGESLLRCLSLNSVLRNQCLTTYRLISSRIDYFGNLR